MHMPAAARPWVLDEILPAGTRVELACLDDDVAAMLAGGADIVLLLHCRGDLGAGPVLAELRWRPGFLPGSRRPGPIWISPAASRERSASAPAAG